MRRRPEPLTVAGLISLLSQYPPEMPVLVDGYEGGYDFPDALRADNFSESYSSDYFGRYDEHISWGDDDVPSFAAVVIPR